MVAGKRLEKYGEFMLVDKLAKTYNYKHSEVIELSWREAFTMIALNREEAYIEHTATEMNKKKPNKKS